MHAVQYYNIAKAPLYFVRSGYVHLKEGRLYSSGDIGSGWSRSAVGYTNTTTASAHSISFTGTSVNPSTGPYDHWYGRSLRCVVGWLIALD